MANKSDEILMREYGLDIAEFNNQDLEDIVELLMEKIKDDELSGS